MFSLRDELNRIRTGDINWRRVFFISVFVALFLEFYINIFGTVGMSAFENFQSDSEGLVIGRIQASIDAGIFSVGGFLTRNGIGAYTSQFGLQGLIFGFFAQFLSFLEISTILNIFRGITALFTSLVTTLIIYWLSLEFEFKKLSLVILPIFIILGFPLMAYSYQFIGMARNLYWVPFTFFVPMLIMIYMNYKKQSDMKPGYSFVWLFFIVAAVFLKCLCGFEYITTILIAGSVPLFYYAIKSHLPLKTFVIRFLQYSISALIGFVLSIFAYLMKLYFYLGDIQLALAKLVDSVAKRTHDLGIDVEEVYHASLDASTISVVFKYLPDVKLLVLGLGIITVFVFTIYFMKLGYNRKSLFNTVNSETIAKLFAGLVASGIAFLAPLSWYIFAKGHSYIHVHMNHSLWYVPFVFIALAVIIYFVKCWIEWHTNTGTKSEKLVQKNDLVLVLLLLPVPIGLVFSVHTYILLALLLVGVFALFLLLHHPSETHKEYLEEK